MKEPALHRERVATADATSTASSTPTRPVAREETLAEIHAALLTLHRARWSTRGQEGVLDAPGLDAFHRDGLANFLARGWLRLYALRIGGRIVAVAHTFNAGGRGYYYIGGFDRAFEKLSPGALLIEHAIREGIRTATREFDFLRGREAYKYAWGAGDRPQYRRRLAQRALPPLPLHTG